MKSATKGMLEAIAHLLEALFSITDQKTQLLTNVIIQCRRNIWLGRKGKRIPGGNDKKLSNKCTTINIDELMCIFTDGKACYRHGGLNVLQH